MTTHGENKEEFDEHGAERQDTGHQRPETRVIHTLHIMKQVNLVS